MGRKKFFEVRPLLRKFPKARYFFLLGGRGTGKTFPVTKEAIKDSIDGHGAFAYVRRYKESLTDTVLQDLTAPHCKGPSAWLEEYTGGKYNRIGYWRKRWYLERWEKDEETGELVRVYRNPEAIGRAFAMNTWETDKGPDFGADKGGIKNIIFDEILSAGGEYLVDEWNKMQNVISSLVRENWEKDTKIFLLANPVSKFGGPYLKNLGISKKLLSEFGTTLIEYPNETGGKADMSTVFCYIAPGKGGQIDESRTMLFNKFFAFPASRGKSKSITFGFWEMEDANILPSGVYSDSTEEARLFYPFGEDLLCCEVRIYTKTGIPFLFFRPASKVPKGEYFVTLCMTLDPFGIIGADTGHPLQEVVKSIAKTNQIYYSDLETADIWHGWQNEAKKRRA